MSRVALVRCETYQYDAVKNAVEKGVNLIGGINKFADKNEKILLKPNILVGDNPDKHTTTHPSVFKAVAELFLQTKAILSYGDSPGFGYPELTAKKAGIYKVGNELNIKFADFINSSNVLFKNGIQIKNFNIVKGVLDADGVISIPKLKTHQLERITGAVKNQMGCIPGFLKNEFHLKFPDAYDFARFLLDINNYIKPRLYIVDGIIAMEGNGPRGGDAKKLSVLLFSNDPIAIDAAICKIINLNPEFVPTIKASIGTGSGVYKEDEIELVGDDINSFIDRKFKVIRQPKEKYNYNTAKGNIFSLIKNHFVRKPYIVDLNCVKCGICIKVCPSNPKALSWGNKGKDNPPEYNYSICFRCYCCQELCPEKAIKLKTPFLRKIFKKLYI
ncbi:MAG: DUF362 domain-containing protein [Spirochaetes bacterium]|nr:DUF362 domain-containing protein [Spirochaetota bacterium]